MDVNSFLIIAMWFQYNVTDGNRRIRMSRLRGRYCNRNTMPQSWSVLVMILLQCNPQILWFALFCDTGLCTFSLEQVPVSSALFARVPFFFLNLEPIIHLYNNVQKAARFVGMSDCEVFMTVAKLTPSIMVLHWVENTSSTARVSVCFYFLWVALH